MLVHVGCVVGDIRIFVACSTLPVHNTVLYILRHLINFLVSDLNWEGIEGGHAHLIEYMLILEI